MLSRFLPKSQNCSFSILQNFQQANLIRDDSLLKDKHGIENVMVVSSEEIRCEGSSEKVNETRT